LISESKIRRAFSELSFPRLKLELALASTESDMEAFLQLLFRSSDVFFKYPNSEKEKLRDDLFLQIEAYFSKSYRKELSERLQEVISVLKRTETGYRCVLFLLKDSPSRKMSPETQCSAAIALAVNRLEFIHNRLFKSIERLRSRFVTSSDLEGFLEDGTRFSIDSATAGFVANLATTLMMFAIENNWILPDGTIVFPQPVACTEEELKWSEETEFLAMSWRRWERVEQRRRY